MSKITTSIKQLINDISIVLPVKQVEYKIDPKKEPLSLPRYEFVLHMENGSVWTFGIDMKTRVSYGGEKCHYGKQYLKVRPANGKEHILLMEGNSDQFSYVKHCDDGFVYSFDHKMRHILDEESSLKGNAKMDRETFESLGMTYWEVRSFIENTESLLYKAYYEIRELMING